MTCSVLELFVLFIVITASVQAEIPSFQTEVEDEKMPIMESPDTRYVFQNRIIERLRSLIRYVDDLYSDNQSEKINKPIVQLLKGACPVMLLEEPNTGRKFRCHAYHDENNCFCFSHKKTSWYVAEAFCRHFSMTLADVEENQSITEWIRDKVNDNSAVDQKGDWYWTSGTDNFIRGQQIFLNTGNVAKKTDLVPTEQPERCYKMHSNTTLQTASCPEENYFICHRFLKFFPLVI